jgi:aspartate carbamoyltransferase regulatory subunit
MEITKNIETQKLTGFYFICDICQNHREIPPNTLIYYKNTNKTLHNVTTNKDLIYDPTLPLTKKYVCVNEKCKTHDNPKIKEAVFYKNENNVKYICKVCLYEWSIN